jgi:hypothetical protein
MRKALRGLASPFGGKSKSPSRERTKSGDASDEEPSKWGLSFSQKRHPDQLKSKSVPSMESKSVPSNKTMRSLGLVRSHSLSDSPDAAREEQSVDVHKTSFFARNASKHAGHSSGKGLRLVTLMTNGIHSVSSSGARDTRGSTPRLGDVLALAKTPRSGTESEGSLTRYRRQRRFYDGAECIVIGGLNMDLKAEADGAWPQNNATSGGQFSFSPGGRGGNEAVAVARLGVRTTLIARVGDDDYGKEVRPDSMRGARVAHAWRAAGARTRGARTHGAWRAGVGRSWRGGTLRGAHAVARPHAAHAACSATGAFFHACFHS